MTINRRICENCNKQLDNYQIFDREFYLHCKANLEPQLEILLCKNCWNLCHKLYYYNRAYYDRQSHVFDKCRIPDHIPYKQHKRYMLEIMK